MTSDTELHRSPVRCATRTVLALGAISVALAATACSGADTAAPAATSAVPPRAPTSAARPPTASTGEAHEALLRDILASHHDEGAFVGARIALLDRGTVTEVEAGTATVGPAAEPVDPDVPWNIGSATKTFVAIVVLQLADEGAIDLDAGIDGWFPELPGAERISVRHLLQHTSGLGEHIDQPAVLADAQRAWTPSELVAVAEGAGRVGEPGGAHHYSNTGYVLLGEIIREVTGRPWADEVRARIVEPLGMTHTSEITDERPLGYKVVDGSFVEATSDAHPSVGGAAGALQSTGRDLLRFATAMFDGTLLSPGSQAVMRSFVPADDLSQFGITHGYGLGLEQYAGDAITIEGHMGTGVAQTAYVGYDAGSGAAIAVMTNTAVPGPQAIMAVEALTAIRAAAPPT